MNLEERVFNEILDKNGYIDKTKKVLTDLYMRAYHEGRHKERDRLVNSGFVIIDPNKVEELNKACDNPCINCEHYNPWIKIGCSFNPQECEKKQKQLHAPEIKAWFR